MFECDWRFVIEIRFDFFVADDNLVMIEEITIVEGEDSDIFRPIAKKFKTGLERVMDVSISNQR